MARDTDTVLELLRRSPPRERLRVVAEVLPGLEEDLPPTPASPAFWRDRPIESLAQEQAVEPIADPSSLIGGWPEDESVDDFLVALEDWRRDNLVGATAE